MARVSTATVRDTAALRARTQAVRAMLAMRKQHKMDDLHEEWAYKECVHTESFPNQAIRICSTGVAHIYTDLHRLHRSGRPGDCVAELWAPDNTANSGKGHEERCSIDGAQRSKTIQEGHVSQLQTRTLKVMRSSINHSDHR